MKRIISIGLLGLVLGACSNQDVPEVNSETVNAPNRFMAISIVSNTTSRTTDDDFLDGDETANVSDKITFFFFNADGTAFVVDDNAAIPTNILQGTDLKKWDQVTSSASQTEISNVLAAFTKKEGSTPSKVIAVINTPDGLNLSGKYSLDDVKKLKIDNITNEDTGEITDVARVKKDNTTYFTMSNSVYNDGSQDVYATEIPLSSVALTAGEAESHPVQIFVERVVAKVELASEANESGEVIFKIQAAPDKYADGSVIPDLYAKVEGWNLFNKTHHSLLLKDISDNSQYSWANDTKRLRSYWGKTPESYATDLESVSLTWNQMKENGVSDYIYPLANTLVNAEGSTEDHNTNIVLATTIQDANGNAVEITRWLSKYYTETGLKDAIANYLANTLFTYEDGVYSSIKPEDITFSSDERGYRLTTILSEKGKGKMWYTKENSTYTLITTVKTENDVTSIESQSAVATTLGKVPPAQFWKEGKCYYYTPIVHNVDDFSQNAIVRNHWYKVNVQGVKGLGTPVYDPTDEVDPQLPTDDENQYWYLDAQITVQSWRIIKQDVTIDSTQR